MYAICICTRFNYQYCTFVHLRTSCLAFSRKFENLFVIDLCIGLQCSAISTEGKQESYIVTIHSCLCITCCRCML